MVLWEDLNVWRHGIWVSMHFKWAICGHVGKSYYMHATSLRNFHHTFGHIVIYIKGTILILHTTYLTYLKHLKMHFSILLMLCHILLSYVWNLEVEFFLQLNVQWLYEFCSGSIKVELKMYLYRLYSQRDKSHQTLSEKVTIMVLSLRKSLSYLLHKVFQLYRFIWNKSRFKGFLGSNKTS